MDLAKLTEIRDFASAAHYANWIASLRLKSVRDRERTAAQDALATRHDDIADVWACVRNDCDKRIGNIMEGLR